MKIPVREQKQPRQYIVKALFELLEHKNYHDITISRLGLSTAASGQKMM